MRARPRRHWSLFPPCRRTIRARGRNNRRVSHLFDISGGDNCAVPPQSLQDRRGERISQDKRPMSVSSGAKRKEGGIGETLRVIFHALVIALVIRTFLF